MVDNVTHEQPISKNLVRNNLIAGVAGAVSAGISQTAAGTIVDSTGQKSTVWFETLDQAGKITSITGNQPVDIAVNNFMKESAVSIGQASLTSMVDN
jgi:hypothetical protein